MPDIGLATSTIRRGRGEMPQMPLVNMFLEQALTEPRQFSLLSHPGLAAQGSALGVGPVTGLFRADSVISGSIAALSGGTFYVNGVSQGTVSGSLTPSLAGNEVGVMVAAGGPAMFYNATDFTEATMPDHANVTKVIQQGGRFILLRAGTGTWYFTEVLEAMLNANGHIDIVALDFATAESEPDELVDAVSFEDAIAFGGTETIEFWVKTGDADLPYTPSTGRVFGKGVRATGCMAAFDNSFAWVSPDNIVYTAGNVPGRISDAGIEELIAASTTCRVDSYFFEGHEFLKLRLDTTTIEYDAQTQQWAERKTGTGNFIGGPVILGPIFGSMTDGNLYVPARYADMDSYHERSFCVGFPLNGGAVSIGNLRLRTNPGQTDFLTGDYTDPTIELFVSYDGGLTFDTPLQENLGEAGQYRREVEWRALGSADYPGFFGKVRVTDPVPLRVSGAVINEPHGGRSR